MKLKHLSLALLGLALLSAGCKRETPADAEQTNNPGAVNIAARDMVVPAGFKFDAEKSLNVRVKVTGANAGERFAIKIYGGVPSTGKLISAGLTDANAEYSTTVRIPAWEEFIYIEKINPDGASQFEKVKANQFASALFTNGQPQTPYMMRKSSGMDCSTCDRTINNYAGGTIYIVDERLCLTGTISGNTVIELISGAELNLSGTITGTLSISVNTGTVRVCGTGTINQVTMDNDGKVYFLEGSSITVNTFVMTSPCQLKNWSDDLRIVNHFFPRNGYIENNGKMHFDNTLYIEYGAALVNNGELLCDGPNSDFLIANGGVDVTNNNYIYVEKRLGLDPFCTLTNNCKIVSNDEITTEGDFINNGYVKATRLFNQFGYNFAYLEMQNGAMISTKDFAISAGSIKGTGANRSKIKVTDATGIYDYFGAPTIEGTIDICDNNGIEVSNGNIVSPAAISCTGYIATSTCNPEGFGSAPPADADNDGVADAQDEYPNDATRAFNSYYPNASSTATVAFEDLWPAQGDYEFNDLVLAFNIQHVLNGDNKVIETKLKVKVKAVGGTYDNGFGIQLDELAPADISTITGQILTRSLITRNANNTEAGQSKAVIICYDSPEPMIQRAGGSGFNTVKTNGTGTSDSASYTITYTQPVVASKLTIDKWNPFIFTNRRRGYEVHMANYPPTDLASASLFGTMQDRTNPGNNYFYKNANGMPWAILVPEDFAWPTEKTPITDAYNFFDDWAISGGSNNSSWYTGNPGNRNNNNIY